MGQAVVSLARNQVRSGFVRDPGYPMSQLHDFLSEKELMPTSISGCIWAPSKTSYRLRLNSPAELRVDVLK